MPPILSVRQKDRVIKNEKLAKWLANRVRRQINLVRCRLTQDESLSAAYHGLCRASIYYNPERGSFATFASRCITIAIWEAAQLNTVVRIPTHIQSGQRAKLPISKELLARTPQQVPDPPPELCSSDDPVKECERREDHELLDNLILGLRPRLQWVVRTYYLGEPIGQKGLGKMMGVSGNRAAQLIYQGLRDMRKLAKKMG